MKASDLMLGDWTLCDGVPRKVSVLIEGQDARCGEPIELTTEILSLNGFNYHDYDEKKYWTYFGSSKFGSSRLLELIRAANGSGFCIRYTVNRMQYVHELQQALKVLGFTELANNFKVT